MKEIFSYRFNEEPNYEKLRFLLMQILLENDEMADNQLDWNEGYAVPENDEMEEYKQDEKPTYDEKDDGKPRKTRPGS